MRLNGRPSLCAGAALAATLTATATLAGCGTNAPAGTAPSTVTTTVTTTPTTSPTTGPSTSATTATTATSGPASTGAGSSSGAAPCASGQLAASLGAPQGAAGSVVRALVLTNTGTKACTLQGFPGVSYVTGSRNTQVGAAAVRVGPRGSVVRLAPGGSAQAPVAFARTGAFDAAECRPVAVTGLRVYPPGLRSSLVVAAPGTGCAGATRSPQLQVRAVVAA